MWYSPLGLAPEVTVEEGLREVLIKGAKKQLDRVGDNLWEVLGQAYAILEGALPPTMLPGLVRILGTLGGIAGVLYKVGIRFGLPDEVVFQAIDLHNEIVAWSQEFEGIVKGWISMTSPVLPDLPHPGGEPFRENVERVKRLARTGYPVPPEFFGPLDNPDDPDQASFD